jgi:tetratricopeptide (TPR) repeat protein
MITCPHCQNSGLRDDSKWCPFCGKNIKKSKAKNLLIASAIVAILIVILWPKSGTGAKTGVPPSGNSGTANTSVASNKQGFTIDQIEFGNSGKSGNIIDSYGSALYASTIKYLAARIKCTNTSSVSLDTTLGVKIIKPDGTLKKGSSSPDNYTYAENITIGGNKTEVVGLSGWGNEDGGSYDAGTYTYEIWSDGKKIYSTAVTLNSDGNMTAAGYNKRGDAYYNKSQYDLAIKDFDRAINLNQNYADAYYNRGWAYLDSGNYEKALNDFNKTIDLNPQYTRAYNGRGRVYEKSGDLKQALEAFNKAVSLDNNYTNAKNNRDRIYNQLYPGPANLKAGNTGMDRVTLTWDNAGEGVSYKIYWRSDQPAALRPSSAITGTRATITGMSAGTTYYFWVSAVKNGMESAESESVTVRTTR